MSEKPCTARRSPLTNAGANYPSSLRELFGVDFKYRKGKLYITGAAATNVDDDFQNGVKFLTMAIDRFRNEKSHTADGNITDPVRAYEYLRLSSLAMHLLDGGIIR